MQSTINTANGSSITLDGSPDEISALIAHLTGGSSNGVPAKRGPGRPPKAATAAKPKASKPVSTARKKQMATQGKYLGTIRQLKAGVELIRFRRRQMKGGYDGSDDGKREGAEDAA